MKQKNRVWIGGGMSKVLICMAWVLAVGAMALPSIGHSQQGLDMVKPEMVMPKHYPYGFDGMGEIGRIGYEDIVIDDKHFALSPDVTYHTLNIRNASKAFFRPGMRVGYLIAYEKVIKSVWLIE